MERWSGKAGERKGRGCKCGSGMTGLGMEKEGDGKMGVGKVDGTWVVKR